MFSLSLSIRLMKSYVITEIREEFCLEIPTETVSAISLPILPPPPSRTVIGRPSRMRSIAAGQSS
jgi:hypothetical protein